MSEENNSKSLNTNTIQIKNIEEQSINSTDLTNDAARNKFNEQENIYLDMIDILLDDIKQYQFDKLKNSGIINKVEIIIKDKIKTEENININTPYSDIIEKLVYIYINTLNGKQMDKVMKDICVKVLDKSSTNFLGSSTLTDEQKEIQAKIKQKEFKTQQIGRLLYILDDWKFIIIINKRLGNCSTPSELAILDLISVFVERLENEYNWNQIFIKLQNSDILSKIEQQIKEKTREEQEKNEDIPYSNSVDKLVEVYLQIMK